MKKLLITCIAGASLLFSMTIMAASYTTEGVGSAVKAGEKEPMSEAVKNEKDGQAFLAANAKKEGVVTLPDGLQYKVVKQGTGKKPAADDNVTVHYEGTTIDGKEFDSSYKRGQPASFPVRGVIPGWTEALQLMPTGSTWMLYIPSDLAYGRMGMPPVIGPNQVLVFKVELLGVN